MTQSMSNLRERAVRHERRKGWSRAYPSHPMVDFEFKLKRSVRRALTAFRASRPYGGQNREFLSAVRTLYGALSVAYDMDAPSVTHAGAWDGPSGASSYNAGSHKVTLRGKRSVVTLLHEFAHARGYGETGAVWWSVNAFRLFWPASFARLRPDRPGSHMLTRGAPRSVDDADVAWREYYVGLAAREAAAAAADAEREAQAARVREAQARLGRQREASRRSAREQEQQLNREAQANYEALRNAPANASDFEVASWGRLGPAARQTIFLRRLAEAERAGNGPRQTAAEPAADSLDPSVDRFLRLDLSDHEPSGATEDENISDDRIVRFQNLMLDEPQEPLPAEVEITDEPPESGGFIDELLALLDTPHQTQKAS